MKRLMLLTICVLTALVCAGGAWAATTVDLSTWDDGAEKVYTGGTESAPAQIVITGTSPANNNQRRLKLSGENAAVTKYFDVTLDNATWYGWATSLWVTKGAVVNLHVKGTNRFLFTKNLNNNAMIHVGKDADTRDTFESDGEELYIIGDGAETSIIEIDLFDGHILLDDGTRDPNTAGIWADGVRVNVGAQFKATKTRFDILGLPGTFRGFALGSGTWENKLVEFDECAIHATGGMAIGGGGAPNIHFKNCTLDLESIHNNGCINVHANSYVLFCENETGSAVLKNTFSGRPAMEVGTLKVAGGAIDVTAVGSTNAVKANKIDILAQDEWGHPATPSNTLLYIDNANTTKDNITVQPGANAIIPLTSSVTLPDDITNMPGRHLGNVVGDFTLFDDYTIRAGETIIVDIGNTLTVSKDSTLTIEEDGELIIRTNDTINDGTIKIDKTLAPSDVKQLIEDWHLTGTGIIVDKDGNVYDNSGAGWDDIVGNTPQAEKDKIKPGQPNLVVYGKNPDDDTYLIAVNPATSAAPYTVPLNEKLDLKVVVTSSSINKLDTTNAAGLENINLSAAVWPLDSDGNPIDPSNTSARVTALPPLPITPITNSIADFKLSEADIAALREYAKQNNMENFVIWVYDVDASGNYSGTRVKMPFVFRVDSPQHTFEDIINKNPEEKAKVTAGDNLVVHSKVPHAGTVATPEFMALNPTRKDVYTLPSDNDLALNLFVAENANDTALDTDGQFEGMNVKAGLRPYDGLSIEQYKGLNDFLLTDGPFKITNGFAGFNFEYRDLYRWARRHRIQEFVILIYDTDDAGNILATNVAREFVFRMSDVDVSIHGSHCSGCDMGAGIGIAATALVFVMARRKKGR